MEKVTSAKLRIGALRQIVPELLKTAFQILSEGTIAEGALLEIVAVPAQVTCQNCGRRAEVEDWIFLCPTCGSGNTAIESGRELDLVQITGEQGE